MSVSNVLLLVSVILLVWAGLVAAGTVTYGTFAFLLAIGLAAHVASHLPWIN